ncbi:metallophosphoesterase [Halapricum desulfuricans]|uniref:Phosphoesterase n=1 Tax=Halapricum desulfuricans TaxID=2841257 RepID=A0A897N2K6_9EURY|nr:metallophosphoesterase [Halapricum desulfuricans]QSG05329.1 ICC-like phosphoesterase [Halapricum desulfuricans]
MLVALGDTHGDRSHRLDGRTLSAVREAEHVCHAGDFTTERVYEAIAEEAGRERDATALSAVAGNSDEPDLAARLPETLTVEYAGWTVVLTHGHDRDDTSLSLLARQEDADVVVVGHTHRPAIERTPHCLIVNPGSHADPRGNRPAHGELTQDDDELVIELRTPDGERLAAQTLSDGRNGHSVR